MDASWIDAAALLAALGLGLAAGALLAEGAVLVPFWRSLEPVAFLAWYERHASLLLRFFGPLEVVPTLLVLAVAGAALWTGHPGGALLGLAGALSVAVLLSFPLYFKAANASFESGSVGSDGVAAELSRWSAWHWARTLVASVAFAAALMALVQ